MTTKLARAREAYTAAEVAATAATAAYVALCRRLLAVRDNPEEFARLALAIADEMQRASELDDKCAKRLQSAGADYFAALGAMQGKAKRSEAEIADLEEPDYGEVDPPIY